MNSEIDISHEGQGPANNAINDTSPIKYYLHSRPEIIELVPLAARKVLDVGCGAGGLCVGLKNRQEVEVEGVELVEQAAVFARSHMDRVLNCTIEEALPNLPDGYYDCIVAADVLEHVMDPWATLIAVKEKLSANGKIVVSLPNVQNWEVVSNLLEGKWDYCSEGILDRTHLRFFTRKSIQELFWNAGLHISYMGNKTYGHSLPNELLESFRNSGLLTDSLEQDAKTFQFLVVAEKPMQIASPRVVIIILNWNGKIDTLGCLESVGQLDYSNQEVIVVDNGSTDGSVDAIMKQYPAIKILQTGANLGYAGGNNVGIRWALEHDADYVLLLNNDTIVSPDLINKFMDAKSLLPVNSVLGAKIYYLDKPNTLWFAGGKWDSQENKIVHIGQGEIDSAGYSNISEVGYITGCALFASSQAFMDVGLLDERYFLTYEETDWCYRAKEQGYKCIFVPDAKLWHKVSSSFGGADSPLVMYFLERNKLLWAKRHLSSHGNDQLRKKTLRTLRRKLFPVFSVPNSSIPVIKILFWSLSSWLKLIKRNLSDPMNQATLMALRDYYLDRFGDCPPKVRLLGNGKNIT
jgi:GT2 family glycosyltransferase/2-polyprenyl-3-methyl-5-hydroxy-6-metoxy-1,4-benzoquinol methylase